MKKDPSLVPHPSSLIPTSHPAQEVDVWWGSCSINSILPSVLAGLATSAAIIMTSWLLPHSRFEQLIVMALLTICWLALLLFWIYRAFGCNYRLTTRRLFVEIGLRHRRIQAVELSHITHVAVKSNRLEKLLGIGRIFVDVHGASAPVVLKGLLGPQQIAEKIRLLCGGQETPSSSKAG